MATTPEELEQELLGDLRQLRDRLKEEWFARDLYRTLVNHRWHPRGAPEDVHVALSWKLTEEIINDLRKEVGEQPMTLAQTGGEGAESDEALAELERLGWIGTPLNTDEHDRAHLNSPEDQPYTPPSDRFAKAHQDAEEVRKRKINT